MTTHPLFLRRLSLLAATSLLGSANSGCALLRHFKKAAPLPPAATAVGVGPSKPEPLRPVHFARESRVGTVRLVGREGRFVLVETLYGGLLPLADGQELHTRSGIQPGATVTANLRLSRERRQPFVAADVVDGQPAIGDAVFVGGPETALPPEAHIAPSLLPAGAGGLLPPPPPTDGR